MLVCVRAVAAVVSTQCLYCDLRCWPRMIASSDDRRNWGWVLMPRTGDGDYNRNSFLGGGVYKLKFLHFKSCTKILHAICSVFLRICAGNNSKRPLFLMSNYWEPHIICSLIFEKWHRFCRARICRFIVSPTRNTVPEMGMLVGGRGV